MTDPRPPTRYKVGLLQMAMSADAEANVQRAVAKVAQAAAAGAQLVCLPELFRSQYFAQREDPELFDLAEPVPGPSTEALGTAAKQASVVVIAPVFERRAAGLYHNSAAVIDADGRVVGVYRKMHIPDDPAYYEKFYFTPGDLGFRAFDTRVGGSGRSSAGTSGIPKARASRRCRAPTRCSTLPRSAGTRRKRRPTEPSSSTPGAPSSAATRSRTAVTSPR